MSPVLGWALAVAAVAAGYVGYGWRGVVLAVSVVAFWLLLQFSRALRAMRAAAQRPVGEVASAVMLQSRLRAGLTLLQILPMTGSLGRPAGAAPGAAAGDEHFEWSDGAGDRVRVQLRRGRLARWELLRAGTDGVAGGNPAGETGGAGGVGGVDA